jgi:rubrerythrin
MSPTATTASGVISFAKRLEDRCGAFYRKLAERFPEGGDVFLRVAADSQKNKTAIVRTYQETVSDALETGFCFEGLDLDEYEIDTAVAEGISYAESLRVAAQIEERAIAFYLEVAEQSRSLLATIPMAFRGAAKRHKKHADRLSAMLAARDASSEEMA